MLAKDFKTLANNIAESSLKPEEAKIRTLVGRFYYYLYHEVKQFLLLRFPNEFNETQGSSHERVRYCLFFLQRQEKNLKFSQLGHLLKQLHDYRVLADYKLEHSCDDDLLELVRLESTKIETHLDTLKSQYQI